MSPSEIIILKKTQNKKTHQKTTQKIIQNLRTLPLFGGTAVFQGDWK